MSGLPEWVTTSYPHTVAKRAAIVWAPESELCACGSVLTIGRFDGREVSRTCFKCGSKEWSDTL